MDCLATGDPGNTVSVPRNPHASLLASGPVVAGVRRSVDRCVNLVAALVSDGCETLAPSRQSRRVVTRMSEVRTLLTGRARSSRRAGTVTGCTFSDWSTGEVIALDLAGHSEAIAQVPSLPLGTAWLPDDRLMIVSSPTGRLVRRRPDGSLVSHADLGKPGWIDIVIDGRGNAYVNGPGFDMMAGAEFQPGFVALVTAGGSVRDVADAIAFSPEWP